jgi:hypothetical protein
MSDGLVVAVGLNLVGPTFRPVKWLGFVISDGHTQPSEIAYVRRLPSDIALFPTSYLRRLKAVGDKALPSKIIYFRRFIPYVRRFWPSDVSPFTVVGAGALPLRPCSTADRWRQRRGDMHAHIQCHTPSSVLPLHLQAGRDMGTDGTVLHLRS